MMPSKRVLLAVTAFVTACGSSSEPKVGPPAVVSVVTAPTSSVQPAAAAGTFAVKVSDAAGAAISGATVAFSVSNGGTATPTTSVTDASGVAQTAVTVGTLAGLAAVTGTVSGTTVSASASLTVNAGPIASLVVAPKTLKFFYVGDSTQLTAIGADKFGNTLPASALTFTSSDPTLVSVSAAGVLKVLRNGGSATITVASGTVSDVIAVTVGAAGTTACTGVTTSATMAVGGVVQFQGVNNGCLRGETGGAEYAIVTYNASASTLGVGVRADGAGAIPIGSLIGPTDATAFRGITGGPSATLVPDENFHRALHERMHRDLPQYVAGAREAYRARGGRLTPALSRSGSSAPASYSSIPSSVAVGDIVTVNVNPNSSCTTPQNHPARVMAVGTKSIVLSDTLNPTGGFVDADFQKFAARFDTLVFPLDVGAFGAPSDIDGNGRVILLFTRSVNELTPAGSNSFVGGFFYGRDLYPKVATPPLAACSTSNQGELFYLLVPDPSGAINGNRRTTGFVDSLTTGVIAHEFQHLINASRRLFVNNAADVDETIWLNEGLSHIAEELLYYQESGKTPRQNLTDAAIRTANPAIYGFWKADAASNFSRFLSYLRAPTTTSPVTDDDQLGTRGATWSFLRYAADRLYAQDGTVWQRFDNSTTSGFNTLQAVYGTDPQPLVRDWTVANYVDDLGITTDARYQHASWNFRDIYTKTFIGITSYPLVLIPVPDQRDVSTSVKSGTAAYLRLSVPAGREALLTFSSGGAAPSAQLQFVVVRTK